MIQNRVALKLMAKPYRTSTPVACVTIWRTLPSKPIFSRETIEENIRLARRDATLEEIMEESEESLNSIFFLSLPQGYQTKMTELGAISDGENKAYRYCTSIFI